MTELEFFNKNPFFSTRDYALFMNKKMASASRTLKTRAESGDIIPVTRGLWANPMHRYFTPYGAIPYLLDGEFGYLSFLTSLHRHDHISQIPSTIQIATTGRGRVLKSPIGEFHFIKLKPELMSEGVEIFNGECSYNLATAEKALLDTFYISTKRGKRFNKLPEIDLENFNQKIFLKWLKFYPQTSQKQILERFEQLQRIR